MQENNKNELGQKTGLFIFESVMALLYLVISFMLLFSKLFENAVIDKNIRLILGILLGFYGIFRVYRAFRTFKNRNRANN